MNSVALAGASVPDTGDDVITAHNNTLLYAGSSTAKIQEVWIDGVQQQLIDWQYGTTFTDQSGSGHDMAATLRSDSSDADVFVTLSSFQPTTEAKAPTYALATGTSSFITVGNMTGNFSTTIAPTFPGADLFVDAATAGSVPVQLPLMIVSCMGILIISLTSSWIMRRFGNGNVIVKVAIIMCCMGILVGVGVFDFWMIMVFGILGVAVGMASQQRGIA
jgi:hypothetical protein